MSRHVYQSSKGGAQHVPLEVSCGIIGHANTPRFAKTLSWKYAHLPSEKVEEDLRENHGRSVSRSHIQKTSYEVGALVSACEAAYPIGVKPSEVYAVSIGRDGTMLSLVEEGYREAMVGTLSLLNANREVLHTIYLADAPEYGKEKFNQMMDREINTLLSAYPHALVSGLADGSAHNWTFLSKYTDNLIVDWWHAWGYIRHAIEEITSPKRQQKRLDYWQKRLQGEEQSVHHLYAYLQRKANAYKKVGKFPERLHQCLSYLKTHAPKMNYALYLEEGFLIGSGITESACKTVIKQRFCGAGMQWTGDNVALLAPMRALVLTPQRWKQVWQKLAKSAA